MYLYIELWKAKEAWLILSDEQRQKKLEQLLLLAQQQPITGVIPFSFRPAGDNWLFDGVVERPVIIDTGVARPSGFHYAAAWMVPTRELITRFEDRVEGLGWWFEYFEQENAWGLMDRDRTVGDMVSPKPYGVSPEDEVIAAVRKYYKDMADSNYDAAAEVMMPGMTVFSPYGVLQKSPADTGVVAGRDKQLHAQGFRLNVSPSEIAITVHGNAATATFLLRGSETPPRGLPHRVAFRGSLLWTRVNQTWRIFHMHISSNDERESWRRTE
jgi:ketosteroid isomerase-like protein